MPCLPEDSSSETLFLTVLVGRCLVLKRLSNSCFAATSQWYNWPLSHLFLDLVGKWRMYPQLRFRKAIQTLLQAISRGWLRNPAPVGRRIPVIISRDSTGISRVPKCIPLQSQQIHPVTIPENSTSVSSSIHIIIVYIDI